MFEQLIRDFCRENNYEVLENYEAQFGEPVTTLAIVVKPNRNIFEVLEQLTSYMELETKELDDRRWCQIMDALEGCHVGERGPDALMYFPHMALQPKE